MQRLSVLGLIPFLSIAASAASAADLPSSPAPIFASPAAESSWAGFYAGSIYGLGLGTFRSSQTASRTASKWGQTSGALIGYNFQSGPFVFGPEGDITVNSIRASNPGVSPGLSPNIDRSLYTARLRGRLGYDLGPFMPFVAAGVAFNETYIYNSPLQQFGQTQRETGLTLGAGLDWRFIAPFFGSVTLRGEYVYDAYPEKTFGLIGGPVRSRETNQFVRVALIAHPGEHWRAPATDAPAADWSGAYAGLLGGGLWTQPRTSLGAATTRYSSNGPEGGIFAGRNFMFGSWMVGFEGATLLSNTTGSGPQPTIASASFRNYVEVDLRGRAGYAFGRFLPYVAVGGDWGRSEQIDAATGSDRAYVPSQSVTFGGGLEYMLNDRWSARAEYLYDTSYKNKTTNLDGLALSQSRRAQSVRLGLAYFFH